LVLLSWPPRYLIWTGLLSILLFFIREATPLYLHNTINGQCREYLSQVTTAETTYYRQAAVGSSLRPNEAAGNRQYQG
jgi:hypothetical protein